MRKETAGLLLALLFIAFAGFRIAIAFSEPTLTYDGYQQLRYTEYTAHTGLPMFSDPLDGRQHVYSPVYHYLIAPFALFMGGVVALKFLPNILFATTLLFVYFITNELTRSRASSILAAILAGFTPIIFSQFINDGSPLTLAIPLFFLTLYGLLDIKRRLPVIIICGILLGLISPLIFLLVAGIGVYLVILAAERLPTDQSYIETLVFLLFFGLWSTLILFKEPFMQYGFSAIYAYLPEAFRSTYFTQFTAITAVATIGVLPLAFGGVASYHTLFNTRIKKILLLTSIAAAVILAIIVRIVDIRIGTLLLALLLSILAGQGFSLLSRYFDKTKIPASKYVIIGVLLLFFLFSSVLPALSLAGARAEDTPPRELLGSLNWIRENTPEGSRILAIPKEGFVVEYQAERPVLIDRDFLLVNNIDTLYSETETIYRSRFAIPALTRLNQYGIRYILFSKEASRAYARSELAYADHECYSPVFQNDEAKVYEVLCDVRTQ